MSIRIKLILAFAFLAVAGLATSLWASYQAVRAAALHRLEADVDRAVVDVQHKLQELRRVADLQVGSISGQSVYVDVLDNAYFADSDLGLVTYTAAEKAAKERERFDIAHEYLLSADLLALRGRPETGDQRELLVLLNREGKVVYNDANPDEYLEPIQGVRIVEEALAGDTAVDLWSSDYVGRFKHPLGPTDPKDLYLVIAQPIFRNQTVIGVMLLGQRATTGLLPQMERGLRGARVVLQTAQDGSMASLVPEAAALTRTQRDGGGPGVDLKGLRYLVRAEDILQDIAAKTPPLGKVFVLLEVEGELRESLNVFWRWILPLSALTLLGAAVVTHVLSKRLAKPLQELEAAARKVGQGDLTVEVTAYGRDEVAKLAVSFNEMVNGLRQRDQIKGLFKRYLNPAVVDELIKHPEKASPGGERRQITVLFSDLVGFTTLSEKLSPEDLVHLLNNYFEQASQVLASHGATLDKFIGDAIMCFWNAPLPQEDHAARACLAALDLMELVDRLRPELAHLGGDKLECRIGMNSGPCIVGNIGSANAQDYTVIGDTVNLASRLESAAKVYGTRMLVAYETVEQARGAIRARELDWLRVKGKAQPVRVYEVLCRHTVEVPAHVETYARGLALYRERRFDAALEAFSSIADIDPPARVFRERCQQLLAHPPGPEWDGVYSLDSK